MNDEFTHVEIRSDRININLRCLADMIARNWFGIMPIPFTVVIFENFEFPESLTILL